VSELKKKSEIIVCGRHIDEYLQTIKRFHGSAAPGIVLGGFLVDLCRELVGPGVEVDAVVETIHCLPDAVQIFTSCTIGNGWLKVLNWDKFAITFFDRNTRSGYRVWLNLTKARSFPNLYNWYMRLIPKKELPLELVHEAIFEAGRDVLSYRAIHMTELYQRIKKGHIEVCPECGEAYPVHQGGHCTACGGSGYYEIVSPLKPAEGS
jgi:formylmethanofuran dehydrogenase subunit E